ncbi:unnamed protein product [Tilletia laevis]|nr:unnamed protein product [Tilletia laevis]
MSSPPPSFQLGSGTGSRRVPSTLTRPGLRSASASASSNRPPVTSTPFVAAGTGRALPPTTASPRTFAELSTAHESSTADLHRGAKRSEPNYVQGTDNTVRAGPESAQQAEDRTLDRIEVASARLAHQSQENIAAITKMFQEQLRVMQQQHEERIQAMLAQDRLRTSETSSPTTHAANRLNQSRRSNAARVFLGAEDQTTHEQLPHDRTADAHT